MKVWMREPGEELARCELTHLEREPIDVGLARQQHAQLARTLEELGCDGAVFAPYLLAVLADADHSRYGVLCMCCCKSAPRRGTHSAHADGL